MNRFDYASLNSTYLMALEGTAPNSYTNTILQFIAAIPAVWAYAAKCQASLYHHNNPHHSGRSWASSSTWCGASSGKSETRKAPWSRRTPHNAW